MELIEVCFIVINDAMVSLIMNEVPFRLDYITLPLPDLIALPLPDLLDVMVYH